MARPYRKIRPSLGAGIVSGDGWRTPLVGIADQPQRGNERGHRGASGIYVASLLERLGIAAQMKPKTKLSTLGALYASVANGDVEIGFNQVSEILAQPTIELVAPLPPEIQNYTQFAPGIVTGSSQTEAARALVTCLSSPAAKNVLKEKGFE